MSGEFWDDMFDLNGDGRVDMFEEFLAYAMYCETTGQRENDGEDGEDNEDDEDDEDDDKEYDVGDKY